MALGIVFDDGRADLGPLTDLRGAFEVRTGALTTLERHRLVLEAAGGAFGGFAALDGVAELVGERVEIPEGEVDSDEMVLLSGRCVLLGPDDIPAERGEVLVDAESGAVVAARLGAREGLEFLERDELPDDAGVYEAGGVLMLDRPWDVVRHPRAVAGHAGLRLVDMTVLTGRFLAAAWIAGITMSAEHAALMATTFFLLTIMNPFGTVGPREIGVGALAKPLGADPQAFALVALVVTGSEVLIAGVASIPIGFWLRPGRTLLAGHPRDDHAGDEKTPA